MSKANRPRLQRPHRGDALAGPLGRILARPWLDPVVLWAMRRFGFASSRLWAAAIAAEGDVDRFVGEIGRAPATMPPRSALQSALRAIASQQRAFLDVESEWEAAFFGDREVDARALNDIEQRWRRISHARFAARRRMTPFVRRIRPPFVRFAVPTPDEVAARFDPTRPPVIAPPPATMVPAESKPILTDRGIEYWVRAPSPFGDKLWAHVFEPEGVDNPPTAIMCHGLGVETELMNGVVDSTLFLLSKGIRVVHPSAPGHNRRCRPGRYGGEALLSTQPLGSIELLNATAGELAVLTKWAREKSGGRPVAVGGTSLGALTAQFMADRTRDWAPDWRPDQLFLVTSSAMTGMLALVSSLAHAVGLPPALTEAGWDTESLARLSPLTDPAGPAPLDPENILLLVATHDTVTPAEDGMALARRWALPAQNVILRDRGHFSAAIGLLFDHAPYIALAERLNGRSPDL